MYQDAITALSEIHSDLERQRDVARARYEELAVSCHGMRQAITGLQQELACSSANFGTTAAVDLVGCRNLGERLERIAMAENGWLEVAHAIEIILKAGVTDAKRRNLQTEIPRWMRMHSTNWEHVARGVYRHLRFGESDTEDR